ncbi:MAG: succinate dehydrogenase assembly factor 2 [Betaproteobacteria bacterium]
MSAQDTSGKATSAPEPAELRRLRWRARRGLLENDLLIGRFLDRHGRNLDAAQNQVLLKLLELSDSELLDLLLGRTEPVPPLDGPEVRTVLDRMRAC